MLAAQKNIANVNNVINMIYVLISPHWFALFILS